MRSFKITTPDDRVDCNAIINSLTDMTSLINENVTVTELPPIPEVKTVETGVLNVSPLIYVGTSANILFTGGNTVDLSEYPELKPLCINIQKTWDFESIPKGSLVEIKQNDGYLFYGIFVKQYGKSIHIKNGGESNVAIDHIKSIRIIELTKDGE